MYLARRVDATDRVRILSCVAAVSDVGAEAREDSETRVFWEIENAPRRGEPGARVRFQGADWSLLTKCTYSWRSVCSQCVTFVSGVGIQP